VRRPWNSPGDWSTRHRRAAGARTMLAHHDRHLHPVHMGTGSQRRAEINVSIVRLERIVCPERIVRPESIVHAGRSSANGQSPPRCTRWPMLTDGLMIASRPGHGAWASRPTPGRASSPCATGRIQSAQPGP